MGFLFKSAAAAAGWNQLKLGAGGWVTGIDIAADGTMVCRGDVFGAWRWDGAKWAQLITDASMPDEAIGGALGCYEIRIAPSNTAVFYMTHGGYVYKTTNSGALWTRTNFTRFADLDGHYSANDSYRTFGPKLAINPSDANHVIAGTPSGSVYQTFDGGNTWTAISGITAPTAAHGYRILFISSSEILIASDGTGVYRSTNTGSSFSLTSSGPTVVYRWDLAANGVVWATGSGGNKNIWKFASGSWTRLTNGADAFWEGIACDPADANYVIVTGGGFTNLEITTDAGSTWSGQIFTNFPGHISIGDTSSDVAWIGNVGETYLSEGNTKFHPVTGKLYLPMGIGILYCDRPASSGNITFSSRSKGLQGMVSQWAISPPGGYPILCNQDRPLWRIIDPTAYPSNYGPNNANPVVHCFGADYASSDPTFIAAIVSKAGVQQSGYSNDGGATWNPFAAVPAQASGGGRLGGHIAVSTPSNMLWLPSDNGDPYNTKDGGATWTQRLISGVPTSPSETGWSYSLYNNSHAVCADRVLANTFYMANYIVPGIYKSIDGGDSWTKRNGASLGWLVGGQLLAVPGNAGHLILSNGQYSATTLKKSIDGGDNWSDVGSVTQSVAFGFGKQIGAGHNPTYYMVGYVSGIYGIWYSVDSGANWTLIGTYPLGIYAMPSAICGDMNIAGRVYVGLSFFGWVFCQL